MTLGEGKRRRENQGEVGGGISRRHDMKREWETDGDVNLFAEPLNVLILNEEVNMIRFIHIGLFVSRPPPPKVRLPFLHLKEPTQSWLVSHPLLCATS